MEAQSVFKCVPAVPLFLHSNGSALAGLDEAVASEAKLLEEYKHRLLVMGEGGTISYWAVLFKSKSISDMLDRIEMIREIAEGDQRMMDAMQEAVRTIAAAKEDLAAEKVVLENKKLDLSEAEETLNKQHAEAEEVLAQTNEELYSMQDDSEILLHPKKLNQF